MTTFQKIIKYLAMAFAIFLTVSITGGVLGMFGLFGGFFSGDAVTEDIKTYTVSADIHNLCLLTSKTIGIAHFWLKSYNTTRTINGQNYIRRYSRKANCKSLGIDFLPGL